MTRLDAIKVAHSKWGTPGFEKTDRVGYAMRARKSPIYRVGYSLRADGVMVVMGSSDESWEAALASCPCEGGYCTNPNCDHPEAL